MRKIIARFIAVVMTASFALVAPIVIPVSPFVSTQASAFYCVGTNNATWGSAYAVSPCPLPKVGHLVTWPVFTVFTSVISVMFNAAYVWNTQCRELTSEEAMRSTVSSLAIFFDAKASKCH